MAADPQIENPYVGPQPFEQKDRKRFFGRDREANELLSLVIANRMSLLYAQSGAGKTSLLNAKLFPMLREREFDVLPAARVRGLIPNDIPPDDVPNPFVFNTLISWAEEGTDLAALRNMTLAEYLGNRPHPVDSVGLPAPRIIIFDQFEELFTAYPDRWRDRKGFFDQVVEALEGGPTFLRAEHITDPSGLLNTLRDSSNPLSADLYPLFSSGMRQTLDMPATSAGITDKQAAQLAYELNRLIRRQDLTRQLLASDAAANMDFSEEVAAYAEQNPRGDTLLKLNRMLLEEAYPQHLPHTSMGDSLLRVLFVIREDFIAQLDPYLPDLPNQLRSRLRLMRLQKRAALEAITNPLKDTSRSFAAGVPDRLVEELLKINVETEYGEVVSLVGEYVEPVQLQVVCENLWNDLPAEIQVITEKHLQRFGNVNEALSTFYESTIAATMASTGIEEGTLRKFFEQTLLTPAGTRGTVYRGTQQTGGIANDAIDVLEDRHIIRGEWRGGSRWYELTHDRFIEPIMSSNERWLASKIGGRDVLQRLEQQAGQWKAQDRRASALLGEFELLAAERWLEGPAATAFEVDELVREYVSESRKHIDRTIIARERRTARRYRYFAIGLTALALLAGLLWIQAVRSSYIANQRRAEATEQFRLASSELEAAKDSMRLAERERAIADSTARLAVEAQQLAEQQLQEARMNLNLANQRYNEAQDSLEMAYTLRDEAEEQAEFAIDQNTRAQVAYARAQQDLDFAETQKEEAIQKLNQAISLALADMAIRQSRLGNDTLAALLAKQAYQFDVAGNNAFQGQVYEALRISLNGLDADSTVRVGGPLIYFDHQGQVRKVRYSPNGRWLASGGDEDEVRLLNLETNRSIILQGSTDFIRCLAFSPDGDELAICRIGNDVEFWDVSGATPRLKPMSLLYSNDAREVVYNPDGETLAYIGAGGRLYKWHRTPGTQDEFSNIGLEVLARDNAFLALAGSEDGNYLVAADLEGRLHLWTDWTSKDASSQQFNRNGAVVNAIAFDPDNTRFATGSDDYRVRLWEIQNDGASLSAPRELLGHQGPVNDLAFSSNGRLLASASSDQTIQVRTMSDLRRQPRMLQDHEFWVWSVDISADNGRIASGSADGTMRIWITQSDELVQDICDRLPGARLSREEWDTFIGDDFDINTYQKPCP